MSFDLTSFLAGLNKTVDGIQALTPLATALGAPPGIVGMVNAVVDAAQSTTGHIAEAVNNGTVIATAQDQDELKALDARLQAQAQPLSDWVDNDVG